jgi:hypothetical protein
MLNRRSNQGASLVLNTVLLASHNLAGVSVALGYEDQSFGQQSTPEDSEPI